MSLRRYLIVLGLVFVSFSLVPAAHATNWSRCHVEQGETTIPNGSATSIVTLTTSITDLTSAFILSQATGTSNLAAAKNHRVAATITDANTATFTRVGTSYIAYVSYSVIQCYEDEFEVKTGTIILGSGVTSNAGTLSSAVTVDDSMVLVSTTTTSTGTDNTSAVTAELQDESTVKATRASSSTDTATAYYQVITFAGSVVQDVQTAEVTLSSGQNSTTSTLTSAVDL
ncbi:MAG: hypothetical protein ACD_21C00148G0004, partial [uncultured bacterium]